MQSRIGLFLFYPYWIRRSLEALGRGKIVQFKLKIVDFGQKSQSYKNIFFDFSSFLLD
jgi:hypothetical protein